MTTTTATTQSSTTTSAAALPTLPTVPSHDAAHERGLRKLGLITIGVAGVFMIGLMSFAMYAMAFDGGVRVNMGFELVMLFVGAAALQRRDFVKRRLPQLFLWMHFGFVVAVMGVASLSSSIEGLTATMSLFTAIIGAAVGACGVYGRRAFKRIDLDKVQWQSGFPMWPIVVGVAYVGAMFALIFHRFV